MSIEASSFVLGLSMGQGNGIRKLILLGYANHTDKHGRGAYPSTRTIADYTECDVRTVQRHLRWLIERGFLHEGDQQMVDHLDPRYRPIVYDVAMSAEQMHQWATGTGPDSGNRARSAEARGGRASSQVVRGDNLSPLPQNASPQPSRGDNLSPLEPGPRGDNDDGSGVTNHAVRGDTGVTRTVIELSLEPSSSSPVPQRAPASASGPGGGRLGDSLVDAADLLDVLPASVRDHPSVIPRAIAKRIRRLHRLGWPRAEIRRRLAGVETADAPGAAVLTRLDSLKVQDPPPSPPKRPAWCGQCDQRTRLREDPQGDDRPYRCPECHPLHCGGGPITLAHAPQPSET